MSQISATVELKKYAYYRELLQIDDVTPVLRKVKSKVEAGTHTEDKYTIDALLKRGTPPVAKLFLALRKRILALPAVWEKVGHGYCDYRTTSTFVSPYMRKKRLMVIIKMGDKQLDDPQGIADKKDFGLGRLNTRFWLKPGDSIDYAMRLVAQAHEYVT